MPFGLEMASFLEHIFFYHTLWIWWLSFITNHCVVYALVGMGVDNSSFCEIKSCK